MKLNHIAIVVNDLEAALKVYRDALGLPLLEAKEVPEEAVKIAFLPFMDGEGELELIQPITDDSGVAKYLAKRGEGIHHICLTVDDLEMVMQQLAAKGLQLLVDNPKVNEEGQKYVFIHPKTTHGVLLELYEKPTMRKQNNSSAGVAIQDVDLSHQQAIIYGRDLVEIYKQERAKREALELAYKKLEGALDSMSDGFLVVDNRLNVLEVNQACADLFELKPEDAVGKPLASLILGNETEAFCNRLLGAERVKLKRQLEVLAPRIRDLLIHAAPLPDGGWVLVLHDVTWEERINNMREEFLNLAAHELRTPLAGIIGFASLLEQTLDKDTLGEDAWLFVQKILKSSERLRDTVNDLLDVTISETSDVNVEAVDLRDVVEDSVVLLNKQAVERGVAISVILPDESMTVFGDAKMLSSAVGHLIENAIRYNKVNGTLTIEGFVRDEANELAFTDSGVGITQKDLDYIFKPFFQVEEHTTRRAVGMGLGLSIVQRTMAMHQGSLSATSEPAAGSVFTTTLPRLKASDMERAKGEWLKIQRNLRNRTRKPDIDEQTQTLINQLKTQLEVTQSQSLAYAQDLAKLYQLQRSDAEVMKAKEAQITHTDRLALMGQMAAGVAHDLSNLISPILGYAQIILRNRDAIDPTLADITERILGTTRRAHVLLRQMVNLSGVHSDDHEEVDLNDLAREMLLLLETKISHAEVILEEDYAHDLLFTFGNPVQISQVILNILVNALDAMPSGGKLTVRTTAASMDGKAMVKLQIADTGEGIAPENLANIFNTFFTTKHKKAGTGLGLSICRDIVENHNGTITVDSTFGEGSQFTILLPQLNEDSQ